MLSALILIPIYFLLHCGGARVVFPSPALYELCHNLQEASDLGSLKGIKVDPSVRPGVRPPTSTGIFGQGSPRAFASFTDTRVHIGTTDPRFKEVAHTPIMKELSGTLLSDMFCTNARIRVIVPTPQITVAAHTFDPTIFSPND